MPYYPVNEGETLEQALRRLVRECRDPDAPLIDAESVNPARHSAVAQFDLILLLRSLLHKSGGHLDQRDLVPPYPSADTLVAEFGSVEQAVSLAQIPVTRGQARRSLRRFVGLYEHRVLLGVGQALGLSLAEVEAGLRGTRRAERGPEKVVIV